MVYRLSRLVALLSVALAVVRLGGLLRAAESGPPWQLVLVAAALMGAAVTWLVMNARFATMSYFTANLLAYILAALRITAPDTLRFGILPTAETSAVLGDELGFALELIRFGSTPVLPVRGLIAVIAVAFWLFGALGAWGLSTRRPAWALLPPLVLNLQLATIARQPTSTAWTAAFATLVALSLMAIAVDERRFGTGRFRSVDGSPRPRTGLSAPTVFVSAVVAAAVLGASVVSSAVPDSGLLEWRSRSGLGGGIYGGVSYNLFVSTVQSDLLSLGDEPVFVAQVAGPVDPSNLYWKLISLENFDGTNWFPADQGFTRPNGTVGYGSADQKYLGNTVSVAQVVQIRTLRMNYLPALRGVTSLESTNDLLSDSFAVRDDGSLRFDARTFEGLTYSTQSQIPNDSVASLATTSAGVLSPLFQAAAEAGQFSGIAVPPRATDRPENLSDFTELPSAVDPRITQLAEALTSTASTTYERAVMLESYFRSPSEFTYSVDIDAGHSAQNLADWLFEPNSPNYRTGYCEQFSTAMAVMARDLGIPARVALGFTPGELNEDGNVVVRQRNAHAWVELWMDGHGWVQFDPTPRADGINPGTNLGFDPTNVALPLDPDNPFDPNDPNGGPTDLQDLLDQINDAPDPTPIEALPDGDTAPLQIPFQFWWVLGIAVAASIWPLFKNLSRRGRRKRAMAGDIQAAWSDIVDRLVDLRHPQDPSLTPLEFAATTERTLVPFAQSYAKTTYGPNPSSATTLSERHAELYKHADGWVKAQHTRTQRVLAWWSWRTSRPR